MLTNVQFEFFLVMILVALQICHHLCKDGKKKLQLMYNERDRAMPQIAKICNRLA